MRKVLVLATACLLMTSCVIDKREMVSAVDKYNESFMEVFGNTDPDHSWIMVNNQTVKVNLEKSSRVKVYVKFGKDYKLAADYENVSGNRELHFDAPMGCEDVYVTVDGVPYQNVGAAKSRTFIETEADHDIISVSENVNDYRVYTYGQIETFKNDKNTLPELVDNTKKVTMDYIAMAEAGKSYTFYPLFWNGEYYHTFGLYYFIGKDKHEFDFYKDKEGDCLQFKNSSGEWENVSIDYVFNVLKDRTFNEEDEVLRSKPYTITFPSGTGEFGFYVKIYSSSDLNNEIAKYYSNPAYNVVPNTETPSFSSFAYKVEGEGETAMTYITIEDKKDGDLDYNDFIFVMEGTQSHREEDPVEYIYAVEDLGGTADFDFNDVVFSVSHVSGQPHANVKLLAAGGTLPAEICFGDDPYGEVHEMFKVSTTEMVNTAAGTTKGNMKKAKSFTVNVGTTWSHKDLDYTENFDPKNGFNVKVNNNSVTIYDPGEDAAPQILVLTPNWLWPTERTRIDAAYPGFGEWGDEYTNSDWVNTRKYSKVVDWVGAPQTNQ